MAQHACHLRLPGVGDLPVAAIDTGLVVQVLDPIRTEKPETATGVRGPIEAVLDAATVRGFRQGPNPAQWKGNLAHILPARARVRKVAHHAALPFDEMPGFLAALRGRPGMAARALEFASLTAARTSEVLGARWGEIGLAARVWTVPAEPMKAGREHRLPLSEPALAVLEQVRPLALMADGKPDMAAPLFAGPRRALPMSNMVMLMLLRRMKRDDLTAHGFRSTFSDWAAERTAFPRDGLLRSAKSPVRCLLSICTTSAMTAFLQRYEPRRHRMRQVAPHLPGPFVVAYVRHPSHNFGGKNFRRRRELWPTFISRRAPRAGRRGPRSKITLPKIMRIMCSARSGPSGKRSSGHRNRGTPLLLLASGI
jgi:integrase